MTQHVYFFVQQRWAKKYLKFDLKNEKISGIKGALENRNFLNVVSRIYANSPFKHTSKYLLFRS